jgi:alcohol dehydrogenase class IV
VLAAQLTRLMREARMPNGVGGVGYGEADIPALAAGTIVQARLVDNAPRPVGEDDLAALFRGALSYW